MRCPHCKHRPLSFKQTLLYMHPFRCERCGAVLTQSRLALAGVAPLVLMAGRALFEGVITGGAPAILVGIGMGVTAWLAESAVTHYASPYRLCDPGFQPQVPPARLVHHRESSG